MGYIKKYAREIFSAVVILVTYLLLRLPTILALPIFTDEAIYIRWAQFLKTDLKFWDYALTDGKQPIFIWFITFFMYLTSNPLLAGRLVSILAGLVTVIGLFFLGYEVFKNKWIGFISAFIYVIYPFALVYDRMALYDSLVGTFAVWGLYLVIRLARNLKWEVSFMLGITAGLGALNKSNGLFTLILLPFSAILLDFRNKKNINKFIGWSFYALIASMIAYGIYSILRISPYFHIIEQKNSIFVYPLKEWITHPFTFFWGNLWIGQRDWFVRYFTYPFIALISASFLVKQDYKKEKILLFLWFIVPFLALALFGKTLYPRYILFMTLSLIPLVAFSYYHISKRLKSYAYIFIFSLLVLIIPLQKDYLILYDFGNATIPVSDVSQYYTDWPSGYGIQEVIKYLKEKEEDKVVLYTQGTFGLLPDAFLVYLHDDPQFQIEGIWPIDTRIPDKLLQTAENSPTYIVFFQPCANCPLKGRAPVSWDLEKSLEIKKPADNTYLTLYKVKPR